MGRTEGERKQISTTASTVMVVLVGGAIGYLGFVMVTFGVYALGEGEAFLGGAALVVGALLLTGVLAVVVSQVRAMLRSRR